ncbi:MAG: rhomboid family intramembrane serine protease [Planctomycetaceae bacterium]|nr:rhomboid family intramembrane serine protease [Planctomycetaceae bacterium]
MGLYDRPYYQDESGNSFSRMTGQRTMILNLIIVNAIVFVVDVFIWPTTEIVLPNVGTQVLHNLSNLLAVKTETLTNPLLWWQFVTYGFAHSPTDAFHLIGNMLGLFFLGQQVEQLYGRQAFLRMYLTSLVVCSVAWSLTSLLLGDKNGALIGASGAVTTVVILFALNFPHQKVLFMMFIPMPAWVLGVLIVGFNLLGMHQGPDGQNERIAFDVHLFGAIYGYLYFKTRADLVTVLQPQRWAHRIRLPKRRPKLKVHDPDVRYERLDEQADVVLKKLHREGEASLSSQERRVLEDYSRRMQQKHR